MAGEIYIARQDTLESVKNDTQILPSIASSFINEDNILINSFSKNIHASWSNRTRAADPEETLLEINGKILILSLSLTLIGQVINVVYDSVYDPNGGYYDYDNMTTITTAPVYMNIVTDNPNITGRIDIPSYSNFVYMSDQSDGSSESKFMTPAQCLKLPMIHNCRTLIGNSLYLPINSETYNKISLKDSDVIDKNNFSFNLAAPSGGTGTSTSKIIGKRNIVNYLKISVKGNYDVRIMYIPM